MTLRTTHAVGAVALLVASGVGHGMWTHRWSDSGSTAGTDCLAQIDQPVAGWQAGAAQPVEEKYTPKGTRATARTFTAEKTGKRVIVSLTSGTPGIVAAHTPDVCFLGSGYKLKAPPTKQTLPLGDGTTASFYMADFEKASATGTEVVRCRWSWSADGTWHAPDYPRLFFAKSQVSLPILYKLYIVHPLGEDDLNKSDPYRTFAADLAAALGQQFPR